ncbi:hypothetical protein PISMIDRAFT_17463 [Pisolithus microcarpus 441]|uniref:DUF8040 domain-containing protein n=1 Tax=Pisolithus microcarpus 441 TaxID=765257 RepID=A0A0C9YBN3_9AGAM|nr:hypothetical protein PISMIDRAFT_17463 [Pisolithus microcarpus 441]
MEDGWFPTNRVEGNDDENSRQSIRRRLALWQLRINKSAGALIALLSLLAAASRNNREAYHTSILSGQGWVDELLNGHPQRIRNELGVHKHVFLRLISILQEGHFRESRNVTLEEQLAIFLYAMVMGLSARHVGERFQRSTDTISRYFKKMVEAFSEGPIYGTYVRLPRADSPIPSRIANNPKFYPFFKDAIGAIDGTHIACMPSANERDLMRNRKGFLSQNCLVACSFDGLITYVLGGPCHPRWSLLSR